VCLRVISGARHWGASSTTALQKLIVLSYKSVNYFFNVIIITIITPFSSDPSRKYRDNALRVTTFSPRRFAYLSFNIVIDFTFCTPCSMIQLLPRKPTKCTHFFIISIYLNSCKFRASPVRHQGVHSCIKQLLDLIIIFNIRPYNKSLDFIVIFNIRSHNTVVRPYYNPQHKVV
jgi:hypothetical protein